MTDDERNELAAAYLDGACTAAERAQVEADPDLLARVGVQRQVQEALAAPLPDPVDLDRRETSLAAALAVFDELRPADEPAPAVPATTASRPVSLAAERRRREERRRRTIVVLGVAAAFVAVVGIASQADIGGGDDDSAEVADAGAVDTSASESAAADALAVEAAPADDGGGDAAAATADEQDSAAGAAESFDAGATESTRALADLGGFTDAEALAAALPVQDRLTVELAERPPASAPVEPSCLAVLADQGLTVVAAATVAGQPVLLATTDPSTPTSLELVDADTCTVTGSVDVPG